MLVDSVDSQKMDLEWASVWRAICKKFKRKMKDLVTTGDLIVKNKENLYIANEDACSC